MHSILLIIEMPDRSHPDKEKAWSDMKKVVSGIATNNEGIERLSENVLMIPLQSALSAFGTLIHVAQAQQLSYRVLFLDQKPEWIPVRS